MVDRDAGPAPDVDDSFARLQLAALECESRSPVTSEQKGHAREEAARTGEARMGAVVVRRGDAGVVVDGVDGISVHPATLKLEPGFKSRHHRPMDRDHGLPIGEVADMVGVATSTLRYYERRRLVVADVRVSGQRRYERSTVRRVVFVQMLQDAGLALDDIQGILDADDNESWKQIARQRLAHLDEQIARLQHSRELLAGALLCRFDHPLDECRVMNDEIDRRLTGPVGPTT